MVQTEELEDVPMPPGKLLFFNQDCWAVIWGTLVIFTIVFLVCVFCFLIVWGLWEFYKRRYNKRAEAIRAKFEEEEIWREVDERMAIAKVQQEYEESKNSFENVRKPSFESVITKQPIGNERIMHQATLDAMTDANNAPTGLYESCLAVDNYKTANMMLLPEALEKQQDQASVDTATAFKENDPSASALTKPQRQQTKTMPTLLTNVENKEKDVIPDRSSAPINLRKSISPRSRSLTPRYQRIRPPTKNRTRSNTPTRSALSTEKYAPKSRSGSRNFDSSEDLTSSYTDYITPATSPTASATATPTPARRSTRSRLNKRDPEKYSSPSTSEEELGESTSNASQLPFHRGTPSDSTSSSAASSATWTSARSTTTPTLTPQKITTQRPTFEKKDYETSLSETMRKAEDIYAGEAPFWTNKALDRLPTANLAPDQSLQFPSQLEDDDSTPERSRRVEANASLLTTFPSTFTQQAPPQQQYFNDNYGRTSQSGENRPSLIVEKIRKATQSPRVSRDRVSQCYDSLPTAKNNDGPSSQFYANHP